MKVFATLTTLLGASSATPLIPQDMRMNQMSLRSDNVMRPSMQMSMDDRQPMDRQMSYQMLNQLSNMRNIYSNSQQAFGPNQYFLKDTFGNYVYGYSDVNSEKKEESNGQSVKGAYAYIMSNGIKRRVDYIADDQGFHILRDNADSSRIKRSVEPDLINTRMTSFMDSSSLRDDGRDMYRMDQDMSSMNRMGMDQQMYSNMMDRDMMGRNMMDRNMMGRNMMDHNMMDRNMMGRNMMDRNMMRNGMMGRRNMYNINQDSGIMRQQMSSNVIGQDMSSRNMMSSNMMGDRDLSSNNIMYRNMMGDRDMSSNNMMGDMSSTNMMRQGSDMMGRMNAYTTTQGGLLGRQQQVMSQKMEMERIPEETFTSTRFF